MNDTERGTSTYSRFPCFNYQICTPDSAWLQTLATIAGDLDQNHIRPASHKKWASQDIAPRTRASYGTGVAARRRHSRLPHGEWGVGLAAARADLRQRARWRPGFGEPAGSRANE